MGTIRAFSYNLFLVLRSLVPLPMRSFTVGGTAGQVLLAMLFACAVLASVDARYSWPLAGVSEWTLAASLGFLFLLTIAAIFGAVLSGQSDRAAEVLVVLFLSGGVGAIARLVWWDFFENHNDPGSSNRAFLAFSVPVVLACQRYLSQGRLWRFARVLPFTAVLGAALWLDWAYLPHENIFLSQEDMASEESYAEEQLDVEGLYAAQPALMDKQLAALKSGSPGKPELFGLLVGGTAHQSVFLSEVEKVGQILEQRFDASGHLITLANSEDAPFDHPMANRSNIRSALSMLAARMDRDEDVVLLFMTSHGAREIFSLNFWQAGTKDLSSGEFATMLDESGLKNVVIVLSSCYSGSFIDDLQAPDRLIITAAAYNRTSFGCSDNVEWTWFGQAYFKEAITQTQDFRAAYRMAKARINRWEWFGLLRSSKPQMWAGDKIGVVLDRLLAEEVALSLP